MEDYEVYHVSKSILNEAAKCMHAIHPDKKYYVDTCYEDAGAGSYWTTVMEDDPDFGGCQALYPVTQKALMSAVTPEDVKIIIAKQEQKAQAFQKSLDDISANW